MQLHSCYVSCNGGMSDVTVAEFSQKMLKNLAKMGFFCLLHSLTPQLLETINIYSPKQQEKLHALLLQGSRCVRSYVV